MYESVVLTLILLEAILFCLMFNKIARLFHKQQIEFAAIDKQAHINTAQIAEQQDSSLHSAENFASSQLKKANKTSEKLLSNTSESSLETISLYLIGAIDYISKENACTESKRRINTIKVLKSQLDISAKSLSRYYAKAFTRSAEDSEGLVLRNGAKAAKNWLEEKTVPDHLSLNSQLN
jgi:hypothetical protein